MGYQTHGNSSKFSLKGRDQDYHSRIIILPGLANLGGSQGVKVKLGELARELSRNHQGLFKEGKGLRLKEIGALGLFPRKVGWAYWPRFWGKI